MKRVYFYLALAGSFIFSAVNAQAIGTSCSSILSKSKGLNIHTVQVEIDQPTGIFGKIIKKPQTYTTYTNSKKVTFKEINSDRAFTTDMYRHFRMSFDVGYKLNTNATRSFEFAFPLRSYQHTSDTKGQLHIESHDIPSEILEVLRRRIYPQDSFGNERSFMLKDILKHVDNVEITGVFKSRSKALESAEAVYSLQKNNSKHVDRIIDEERWILYNNKLLKPLKRIADDKTLVMTSDSVIKYVDLGDGEYFSSLHNDAHFFELSKDFQKEISNDAQEIENTFLNQPGEYSPRIWAPKKLNSVHDDLIKMLLSSLEQHSYKRLFLIKDAEFLDGEKKSFVLNLSNRDTVNDFIFNENSFTFKPLGLEIPYSNIELMTSTR